MLKKIVTLTQRKKVLDFNHGRFGGVDYYLDEIGKELKEVEEELSSSDDKALEEELGDVLWDYLNLIQCLKQQRNVSLEGILQRCEEKYEGRISGLEQGLTWQEVKEREKSNV